MLLNKHQAQVVLAIDSHDEGKYGMPWSGNDWDGYNSGKADRQRTDQINRDLQNRGKDNPNWRPGNFSGGNGDGNGCGMIILIVFGLVIIIPSAIAAIVSGTLLFFISKIVTKPFPSLSFGNAYKIAFWTSFIYLLVALCLGFLQSWLLPYLTGNKEQISIDAMLKFFYLYQGQTLVKAINLFEFHLVCTLAASLMFKRKMDGYFQGFTGYMKAIIVTVLIILPTLLVTFNYGFHVVSKHSFDAQFSLFRK